MNSIPKTFLASFIFISSFLISEPRLFASPPNPLALFTDVMDDDISAIIHMLIDPMAKKRLKVIVVSTAFPHLANALKSLGIGDSWADFVAGFGRVQAEYRLNFDLADGTKIFEEIDVKARAIVHALGFEKSQLVDELKTEISGEADSIYALNGKVFESFDFLQNQSLITDLYGMCAYSENPMQMASNILNKLKKSGRAYIHLGAFGELLQNKYLTSEGEIRNFAQYLFESATRQGFQVNLVETGNGKSLEIIRNTENTFHIGPYKLKGQPILHATTAVSTGLYVPSELANEENIAPIWSLGTFLRTPKQAAIKAADGQLALILPTFKDLTFSGDFSGMSIIAGIATGWKSYGSDFRNTDLGKFEFRSGTATGVNSLGGSRFQGANLSEVSGLENVSFEGAFFDTKIRFPNRVEETFKEISNELERKMSAGTELRMLYNPERPWTLEELETYDRVLRKKGGVPSVSSYNFADLFQISIDDLKRIFRAGYKGSYLSTDSHRPKLPFGFTFAVKKLTVGDPGATYEIPYTYIED